jgi:predicted molibdopterin-dependent oxidoreductase YjgC
MRIEQHPILTFETKQSVQFTYDGKVVEGKEGDTIASALHAAGVMVLSTSILHKRPRGFYCAIGNCASCNMTVNGVPNVKTCITPLEKDMIVVTQSGKGEL